MVKRIESRVFWTSIPPAEPALGPERHGFHLKFLLTVRSQALAFTPGAWAPLTRFLEPFAEYHKMESCSKRFLGPQVFEVHLSVSGVPRLHCRAVLSYADTSHLFVHSPIERHLGCFQVLVILS